MTFLHPEFIYMMLPILMILFALLVTQSDAQEQVFSPSVLERLRVDTKRLSSRVRNVFYFLMFLFIILALAGPVVEMGRATVKAKSNALFVALDISDSMLCEDLYPNRLERSKMKLLELLQKEKSAEIGLLAFAKESYLLSPPTLDRRSLAFFVNGLHNRDISAQGTNILMLLKAADTLFDPKKAKKLLVISDGGESRDFSREIAFVKARGIEVYVLGAATDKGAPLRSGDALIRDDQGEPLTSRLNRGIALLAEESGGRFVPLEEADLPSLSERIFGEKSDQTEREQPIYFHLFVFFIGMAMLMLVIATSSFGKGERYHLPALLLLGAMAMPSAPLDASLLDYRVLDGAREAYAKGEYGTSARAYHRFGIEHRSAEAIYNEANALYRSDRFESAANLYASIRFVEGEKNHRLYHNLGNALAKVGDEEHLEKAAAAYREALKFRDDRESRENLAMVEKALREKKSVPPQQGRPAALPEPAASRKSGAGKNGKKSAAEGTPFVAESGRGMSEMEAQKWLKRLAEQQESRIYKIEVADPDEGADAEARW